MTELSKLLVLIAILEGNILVLITAEGQSTSLIFKILVLSHVSNIVASMWSQLGNLMFTLRMLNTKHQLLSKMSTTLLRSNTSSSWSESDILMLFLQ